MLNHFFSQGLANVQSQYGWHMHDGGYMFGGSWGLGAMIHVILWLLILAAIVVLTLFLARGVGRGGPDKDERSGPSALDQLDERYARGEIDREEYLQRKNDILKR